MTNNDNQKYNNCHNKTKTEILIITINLKLNNFNYWIVTHVYNQICIESCYYYKTWMGREEIRRNPTASSSVTGCFCTTTSKSWSFTRNRKLSNCSKCSTAVDEDILVLSEGEQKFFLLLKIRYLKILLFKKNFFKNFLKNFFNYFYTFSNVLARKGECFENSS